MYRKLAPLVQAVVIAYCGCTSGHSEEINYKTQNITGNGGSLVSAEYNTARQGLYREVMFLREGCTGTIVAPYTVMTAAQCYKQRGDLVEYIDASIAGAEMGHRNPYLHPPYQPAWWTALNTQQQQNGGPQDDSPGQHDQALLFVPYYSPEFLAANGIEFPVIDPYEQDATYSYKLVGVGSTGGDYRDYMSTSFVPAVAGSITQVPRDGYLTRNALLPGQGTANPGDFGGPTLGSILYRGSSFGYYEGSRHLVGITHNQTDMAPLAYDAGDVVMTPNQRRTVRLNALWAQARIQDIDNDNLVGFCDPSPGLPTVPESSRCPEAVGAPKDINMSEHDIPLAALTCKPGYVADGYRGTASHVIDQLAVHCRAISCYHGGGPDCDSYWTDHFGGDGGSPFEATCNYGEVLIGLWGKDVPGVTLRQIGGLCAPYNNVRASNFDNSRYIGSLAGNNFGQLDVGEIFTRWCSTGLALSGFQARSTSLDFVTGLQPVCMDLTAHTDYLGGQGGQQVTLSCPVGYVATGTLQNETSGGTVNGFGIVCSPRYKVESGLRVERHEQLVIHGSAWNYPSWIPIPAMRERRDQVHMPPQTYESSCSVVGNGSFAMSGMVVDTSGMVDSIRFLHCTSTINAQAGVAISVSSNGDPGRHIKCPASHPFVKGMTARTGWLLDGIALDCTS